MKKEEGRTYTPRMILNRLMDAEKAVKAPTSCKIPENSYRTMYEFALTVDQELSALFYEQDLPSEALVYTYLAMAILAQKRVRPAGPEAA